MAGQRPGDPWLGLLPEITERAAHPGAEALEVGSDIISIPGLSDDGRIAILGGIAAKRLGINRTTTAGEIGAELPRLLAAPTAIQERAG